MRTVTDLRKRIMNRVRGGSSQAAIPPPPIAMQPFMMAPQPMMVSQAMPAPIGFSQLPVQTPTTTVVQLLDAPATSAPAVTSGFVNPFTQLPSTIASDPGAAMLLAPPTTTAPPQRLNAVTTSAGINSQLSSLVHELNQRRQMDNMLVNQLQSRLDELQGENRRLLQQVGNPVGQEQRTQLQLLASQMSLQDQALQTQLLIEQYSEKIREQNIILSCFQQELQSLKDKVRDLEYAVNTIDRSGKAPASGMTAVTAAAKK